ALRALALHEPYKEDKRAKSAIDDDAPQQDSGRNIWEILETMNRLALEADAKNRDDPPPTGWVDPAMTPAPTPPSSLAARPWDESDDSQSAPSGPAVGEYWRAE